MSRIQSRRVTVGTVTVGTVTVGGTKAGVHPSRVPARYLARGLHLSAPTTNVAAPTRNSQIINDNMFLSLLRNMQYPTASTCYLC
jgi:hypothetical protein